MRNIFRALVLVGFVAFAGCETVPKVDKLAEVDRILAENPNAILDLSRFRDVITTMPAARVQTAPQYPFELKRAGATGSALIEFRITNTGKVVDARVVRATHPLFGEAGKAAVEQWSFEPAKIGNKPVGCGRVQQLMHFDIN